MAKAGYLVVTEGGVWALRKRLNVRRKFGVDFVAGRLVR